MPLCFTSFYKGHLPLPFSPGPSVREEHQFALAPLLRVALLALAVRGAVALPVPRQRGRGLRLALYSTPCRRHLRQIMLQKRWMEGHGRHGDRSGAARVLSFAVRVVDLLRVCLTERTREKLNVSDTIAASLFYFCQCSFH